MKVHVVLEVDEERLRDMLVSALEGGSNYWYRNADYVMPHTASFPEEVQKEWSEYPFYLAPFAEGGYLILESDKDEEGVFKKYTMNKTDMVRGLQLMSEQYPHHFADFLRENNDATTADVWLQLSLWGEVVFG